MKVERIELTNYKRFSHLIVEGLSMNARLIVLVGPNGSGKSSLIEALNHYSITHRAGMDMNYFSKGGVSTEQNWQVFMNETIKIKFFNQEDVGWDYEKRSKMVYVRTAYRNESEFSVSQIGGVGSQLEDQNRPTRMTQNESRVSSNTGLN